MRPLLAPLPVLLLLAGCSDHNFAKIPEGEGNGLARIEVSPGLLQFGELSYGEDPVVQSFTIKSVGDIDLTVSDLFIEGEHAGSFTLLSDTVNFVLPPGAEQTVDVVFEPLGANDQVATAYVASDDEEYPLEPVELYGSGSVPELQISPDPLDFESAYIGCDDREVVELSNVGTDTLEITDVGFEGDSPLALVDDYSLPITLEPGEATWLSFTFTPREEAAFTGTLSVTSNEPLGTRTADQAGEGRYAGFYTDLWEIPEDPPTDLLFAVDQSCSMDDDSAALARNFSTFISLLGGYSNDWQVIVSNDDDGCSRTGILTPTTPNYESTFSSQVTAGGGAYTEALLTVANNAIHNAYVPGGCNSGFMREGAALHIIVVSDEREQSPQSWSTLVSQIQGYKGDPGMVKISAIAGDYPGGCGSADAGDGYYQAVTGTSGEFLSICSDWASAANLERLASASVIQTDFELQNTPLPDTIEVVHNAAPVAETEWSYDAASNTVSFATLSPTGGDTVEISYAGLAACD